MKSFLASSGSSRWTSRICAVFVLVVGVLVLAGWIWDISILKNIRPRYVSMKPNSAVCFLLTASSLLLLTGGREPFRRLARLPVWLTIIVAGLVLVQHLTRTDLGIDQLLITDVVTEGSFSPGRMSLNSALCFLLISIGVLLMTSPKPFLKATQVLFAFAFLTAWAALLSYSYQLEGFTGSDNYTQMALHTAVCFMALSTGFLVLSPGAGYMALFSSGFSGGKILRNLLLIILLLPVLVGSIIMQGYHAGGYSLEFAVALFGVVYTVLLLGVLYFGFTQVLGAERERLRQAQELKELNLKLTASLQEISLNDEELKAANRELQNLNLDLLAANQNLVTAKAEVERLSAQAVQTIEQKYSELTDNMEEAFRVLDKDLRTIYCNKAAARTQGMPREMSYGKTLTEIFGPQKGGKLESVYRKVIETGATAVDAESLSTPFGLKHLEVTAYPTADGGAFGIIRDITKRREAEEGLHYYKFLVDHTEDPLYSISPEDNFRFSYVNRAACVHYGLPEEKLLSLSIPDLDPGFTFEDCLRFSERIREEKRLVFETTHRHSGGEVIPVEVSATLLYYKGREYYAGYIRDLRERRKAEAARRESEDRYRQLFQSNKDPLFLVDMATGVLLDINPAACRIYGYSREELLGMKNTEISAEPEETLISMQEKQESVPLRYHRKKDGTVFPVELVLSYLTIGGREMSIVAVRDITDRLEAERRLEEKRQRLELALWGADLGMWDWHVPSGQVVRNEQFARMLGFQPGELGNTFDFWGQSLHPDDAAGALEKLKNYLAGRTDHYSSEQRIMSKTGEWVWTVARGKVVERDSAGNPVRVIGIQQDISEMKKAEESLRFFKFLIENSPDPIYWIDPQDNFRFAYVNDAASRHYGVPAQQLMTMSIPDWDPTFTPEYCHTHWERMRKHRNLQFETLHRVSGGREVQVEVTSFLIVYQGKEYFAGHFRDISARKKAESALRESEEKYRTLFESIIDPLLLIDMETLRILDVNPAACQVYGYPKEELVGMKNTEISAEPEETLNATLSRKSFVKGRLHRRKDGSVFPVEISASFTNHNGRPVSIGASRDVTERIEFTRKLEEEKQRLELALWGGNLGLWDWDIQKNKVVFNENYAHMLGYTPEELIPNEDAWMRLLHPDDKIQALEALELHLNGKQASFQVEQRMQRKDGTWIWILGSGRVISRDGDGRPLRMVGTHIDITSRKEYEGKMLHLNEELERKVSERTAQLQAANKELEAFSYSVSHDLRSPLRSIDGFSKVLLTDYENVLDEEGRENLHTIRSASQRMGHLIDDLLKLSRVSRAELHLYSVDVSGIAEEIRDELQRENPGRKVDWQITPGLKARADGRLLHIAMQNLLSNAWKYSSKKEEATITISRVITGRGEAFCVKDNGAGFDMRYASQLFGAFQRMHSSREFEGTGIGLAIVQRIILKHGGEIWAEAELDKGAAFFFKLPDQEARK